MQKDSIDDQMKELAGRSAQNNPGVLISMITDDDSGHDGLHVGTVDRVRIAQWPMVRQQVEDTGSRHAAEELGSGRGSKRSDDILDSEGSEVVFPRTPRNLSTPRPEEQEFGLTCSGDGETEMTSSEENKMAQADASGGGHVFTRRKKSRSTESMHLRRTS